MTTLTNKQIQLEDQHRTNALGKNDTFINSCISSGNESRTSYGRDLLKWFADIIKSYYLNNHFGTKDKMFYKFITPAIKDDSTILDSVSYTVANILVNQLSSEPQVTSLASRMSKSVSVLLNISPSDRLDFSQSFLQHFASIIFHIEEKSVVFTVERSNDASLFLKVTEEYLEYFEKQIDKMNLSTHEYAPMVCKPVAHTNMTSSKGGYLKTHSPLLKYPRKDLTMGTVNSDIHHCTAENNPSLFELINSTQETPYAVNTPLLTLIKELANDGLEFDKYKTSIDSYEDEMASLIEQELSNLSKVYELNGWGEVKSSGIKRVTNKYRAQYVNQVRATTHLFDQATYYSEFDSIYYPIFFDNRGRCYTYASYGLFPQGCELSKALLTFANKEVLTESGVDALYATLGNSLGYDKLNIDTKVALAKKWYASWGNDYSVFPLDIMEVTSEGEFKPFDEAITAMAVCIELEAYYNDPTGYKSGYIAHRDARCSGSSIIGTMLKDYRSMSLTSVTENNINTDKLPDAYMDCCLNALDIAEKQADNGCELAQELISVKDKIFTRNYFKHPVMVGVNYGGTYHGLMQAHFKMFEEQGLAESISNQAKLEFTKITSQALQTALPACVDFLSMSKDVAKEIAKTSGEIAFTNPFTGFPYVHQEFKSKKVRIELYSNGSRIKLVSYNKTSQVDNKKLASACSPNLIHGTDAMLLMETRKRVSFDLTTIHDSIGSHPNNCDAVVKAYADSMHALCTSNYLQDILDQLGSTVKIPYSNTATAEDIEAIKSSKHILA